MSFTIIRQALKTAKKIKKTIDAELKEGLIPTPKEAKGKNVQNTTQAKARSKKLGADIKEMEGILKGPDSKAATQKGLRFSKRYEVEDGRPSRTEMQIDAELRTADVARGSRKPSVTVGSKSEAGGVVAESTSKGMRKRAEEINRLQKLVDTGKATKAEIDKGPDGKTYIVKIVEQKMIAELVAANAAFTAIKTAIQNGRQIADVASQVGKFSVNHRCN